MVILGAGENFNILEYTDSEIDHATAEHQQKSLGDQHNIAYQSAVNVTGSVQDSVSSVSVSTTDSTLVASSLGAELSTSCAAATSSVTPAFTETVSASSSLSVKSTIANEASLSKSLATSEEATKSEGSRTSESSAKSVPTSVFMTTDFQAKFLEFSQRKSACVTVGQTATTDDQEAAGSTSSVKGKKVDLSVAPTTLKKSSPVGEEPAESVEMKSGECPLSASESRPELPATTLPMQVDGCCDSDDTAEESSVVSDVDVTVPNSSYNLDMQYVEFVNEEEPELVAIWQSSIGLQVDGAADDDADDAKESQEQDTSSYDDPVVTDNLHQPTDESEEAPAADTGTGTSLATGEVTAPSCSSAVLDSSCSDSAPVSVNSTESLLANDSKSLSTTCLLADTSKQLHLLTDVSSAVNLTKDSELRTVLPHLPSDANVPKSVFVVSTSKLQPSTSTVCDLPVESTAPVQSSQSSSSQTLEHLAVGVTPVVTAAVTPASATSLAAELQSSSACEGAPLSAIGNSTALQLELTSQIPSVASSGDIVPSRQIMSRPLTTTEASILSVPCATIPSKTSVLTSSVTSGSEMATTVCVQSGMLSQCLAVSSSIGSECSAVSASSQPVESYPVSMSAVAVNPASGLSMPVAVSAVSSTAVVAMSMTSHVDNGNNMAAMNPPFNGAFQLRPEMQHASVQQFMSRAPRRMYLPPEFHMQHRLMQRGVPSGEGRMIPAEQLPHGPPPPYPNKQFTGPQTLWVRQHHPSSGMTPEWIRHPSEFGHRPLPPSAGSHEWSRPQMMPADWSGRHRMPQEWVYFSQQPHHPSQAPHQWVRPPYSNMAGFQLGSADAAQMQTDVYNSSYQPAARNTANTGAVMQDAQGVKSSGSVTPHPSSQPSGSPVPTSPASARADMASPQSRSHTPRSMSRSSTPQAPVSGTSGMSHTPDHIAFPTAAVASPHPSPSTPFAPLSVSTIPTSSPMEQSSLPSSSCQASSSEAPKPAVGDLASESVSGAESRTSQPVVCGTHADNPTVPVSVAQLAAFPHASADNMMYMNRPPHGMPVSLEMRRMGPAGVRYSGPPSQGMYMPGHPGPGTSGMTFYRMPSSAPSSHSAIGALLNQRAPVGMSVHYPSVSQAPGPPVMESRYQLIHTQDVCLPHTQRHTYSSAVTVAGPSASAAGSFVLQHQQRGPAPPMPADSAATHQEVPNQTAVLPNSMQTPATLRGPFRMPQQLGPGSVPMGMRVAGAGPPMVYGPQRPVPPPQVRMIATGEMRPQMIHVPRSSVAEFSGPTYRPRPPGEQPLLLEDLLEQVYYSQLFEFCYIE